MAYTIPYLLDNRSDVIGGSLKVDLYEEKMYGFNSRILYAPSTNVPVQVMTKSSGFGSGLTIEEYFNWIHQKPAAAVFALPAACKNARAARNAPSAEIHAAANRLLFRK